MARRSPLNSKLGEVLDAHDSLPNFTESGAQSAVAHVWSRGLVGGSALLRRAHGRPPRVSGPILADPYGDDAEQAAFAKWIEGPGPLEVEIGFGRGRFFEAHALACAGSRLLGFEVRTSFVQDLMDRLVAHGFGERCRVIQGDARPVVEQWLPRGAIAAFHVNFPDPWWKKRHEKRTVLSDRFIAVMAERLAPGGAVWFRTDVAELAQAVTGRFEAHGGFETVPFEAGELPPTWRETRCEDYGIPVARVRFVRKI